MTARLQSIADFLRDHGPATTKQISAHFGWLPQTGSAAVSHAQAYGLISQHQRVRSTPRHFQTVWAARGTP